MNEEDLKQLLESINKGTAELRAHVDKQIDEIRKAGAGSDDTKAAIERINGELTELRKQYEEAVKQTGRPNGGAGGGHANPEVELRKSAFEKFLRRGMGESGRSVMTPEEIRALSQASDADGGFLVPTDWESELITQAYNEAAIRPVAQVGPTGRDTVFMPAIAKPTVGWGKANVAVSPQEIGTGGERMQIFDLRALTLIHNNTLDDADADVWGELMMLFSAAIAEAEDNAFAIGAGNESPQGVLAHSGLTKVKSGVAGALTDSTHKGFDRLISALYGLKKTYRRNATWAFNSNTEAVLRTLKDGNDQYLWQPPVQAGAPATLLGRPIINPEGMPDIAANAVPIVIGDWRRGYKIRDRRGITVQRLVERYAEYDQTGFMIKRRVGGQCVLPEAFKGVQIAAD